MNQDENLMMDEDAIDYDPSSPLLNEYVRSLQSCHCYGHLSQAS